VEATQNDGLVKVKKVQQSDRLKYLGSSKTGICGLNLGLEDR
jgi:hypothetical protein